MTDTVTSATRGDEILLRVLDPGSRGTLYPLLHQLRETAPVFKSAHPAVGGSWVLSRYDDIETVLRHHVFNTAEADSPRIYNTPGGQVFYETMRTMLHNLEFPEHQRIRKLIGQAFTVRSVEALRTDVERLVGDLLDDLAPRGQMEFIGEFAHPFPAAVILRLMAVPEADHEMLRQWADDFIRRLDFGTSIDPAVERAGDDAALGLRDYFRRLLEKRRDEPGDDLISALAAVRMDDERLLTDEIVSTAIVLFEGGHQTTTNLFGTSMVALLSHPRQLEHLIRDPGLTKNACEELLRFDAPVQVVQRVAVSPIDLGDAVIPQGDIVLMLVGAANRDPARFAEPDNLSLDRPDAHRHLSFGNGAYHCIGAPLARLNFGIAIRGLLSRLPGLRADYEVPAWGETLVNWGPKELPLRWDIGPRGRG